MKCFFICLVIYIILEIVVGFIFNVIAQVFYKKMGIDFKSLLKGVIERLFLAVALINGYPHALTLFSALKLGTRLNHKEQQEDNDKYNDYYLIGNLVSVMVAMGYVWLYHSVPNYINIHF
jgi:hypothetical protein